ncbi:MAG: hypothetical protein F6J93_30210 [Oscillatoria sp. SIO1A7]|nr:hypothetical protein [Oscillatoria sp. SIO1A7]
MKKLTKKFLAFLLVLLALASWNIEVARGEVSEAKLAEINELWQGSAHAMVGANCSSCHQDSETKELVLRPTYESCRSCHEEETNTFLLGKHGIRLLEGETPLTPSLARLPMKASALSKSMTCNTCHDVHSVDTFTAAVDSCLSCHNDRHSLNYKNSKHAELVAKEGKLPRPSSESVTCATCHLPRYEAISIGAESKVQANHNNTYTLKPRDRMVKDVCMQCHGMEFSYNSIFDDELVEANFDRPPNQDLKTLEMVRTLKEKRSSQSSLGQNHPDITSQQAIWQLRLPYYIHQDRVRILKQALFQTGFRMENAFAKEQEKQS